MARYFRRGTSKMYYVPVVEDVDEPTLSELESAIELSCELSELSGFTFSNSPIDTPDMCAEFVSKIPGEDTAEDSSITFYEHNAAEDNPIRDALVKGVLGYVVFFPYGVTGDDGGDPVPDTGDAAEVWPISVASSSREWSAGNDAARYVVEFTITSPPSTDAVVVEGS